MLAKGIKANPDDHGLMQIYEDTQIGRLKRAIERPEAAGAGASRGDRRQGQARRADRRCSTSTRSRRYRRRAKLHPEDAKVHYELGMILARTGAHDEAIPEFQQAARLGTVPAAQDPGPARRWG